MHLSLVIVSLLISLFAAQLVAKPSAQPPLETQRELFLDAERALEHRQLDAFGKLQSQLQDYPLYPYLEYQALRDSLSRRNADEIRQFMQDYRDTPLVNRLQSAWLDLLANKKRWQDFLAFYEPGFGETLQCHYFTALLATGDKESAWPLVEAFWLHAYSRPGECDPVFKQWRAAGQLSNELAWQRIALALDANQVRLARYLRRYLDKSDQDYLDEWLELRRYPHKAGPGALSASHPYRQLALVQALEKLSREDLEKTLSAWEQLVREEITEPALIARMERRLALRFVYAEATPHYDYLVFSEPCENDTDLQVIRIRAALLQQQWDDVLRWLELMPDEEQQDDRWRYWKARALQQLGKDDEAQQLFQQVAAERSFYGFMAADRLGLAYSFNEEPVSVSDEIRESVALAPAVARTRELLALERVLDARREWYHYTRSLEPEALLAAAEIAHQWQWHDRVIMTLTQAQAWNHLGLRFPVMHHDLVREATVDKIVDPAWVYAIIRKESAFMKDAHSPAGALGLMQLMPATARAVARKLREAPPTRTALKKPETNIRLGSDYFEQMLTRFNQNPVLAIASYNAGPHRVQRWLPESGMPADVWIELIPFRETRNYVKSVLAYRVIYAEKLGISDAKMATHMPDIESDEAQNLAQRPQKKN